MTSPTSSATALTKQAKTSATPPIDRDKDYESTSDPRHYYDADDYDKPYYPDQASAADTRAVTVVVRRYIAAAAAENGTRACALIYSLFEETIPETFGQPVDASPNEKSKTCGEVMTAIFRKYNDRLAAEAATVQVTDVRTNGRRGLALLRFRGMAARSIRLHRERGAWKIDDLLDAEVS